MKRLLAPLLLLTATPAFAGTYDVRTPGWNTDYRPVEVTAADGSQHVMTAEEEALWRAGHRRAQNHAWTKFWILQSLSAADAATTCIAVANGGHEVNPIYGGSHPPCGRVIGIKAGIGVLQYFLLRHDMRDRPHKTGKALNISIAIQGAVVVSNIVQLAK